MPPGAEAQPILPRVSVVVVNYNYGRFLAQAIESVFAQTYPRIECLVVDNGSTDESAAVIAACRSRHPTLQVRRRAFNGGQTLACFEGLEHTSGPYVIFLDADDYLLPHCVATHVAAHLSSRYHVGFTSGDMLQVVDGQTVLSTSEAMNAVLSLPASGLPSPLRPTQAALGALWTADISDLGSRVRLVQRTRQGWVWAPTSGNCFRRDALDLFRDGENLADLKSQTDLFLALGINAICGSLLIDEPLFAYRLHGSNVFAGRPQLQGVLSFDVRSSAQPARTARRLILEQMVGKIERFVPEPGMARAFFAALSQCDVTMEAAESAELAGAWRGRSFAAYAVARRYRTVCAAVGALRTLLFLVTRRAPLQAILAAVSKSGAQS